MGSYIPSTKEERQEMLAAAGYESIRSLFKDVPAEVYLDKPLNLPQGMSELEVRAKMQELAGKNTVFGTILRGAGAYDHYIPSIVKYITSKEEFVTSYTPYQAEMSQGILQSIFEYQTMICDLTGMDTANASVYDGASAAAEAAAMCRDRKRSVALVSAAANPDVIATMQTYCFGAGTELRLVPAKDGRTDLDALKAMLTPDVCCVYVQQPNFYGQFEEAEQIAELTHAGGAKYIMGVNPIALAIMKTPAECGADIAVGEGQPLGLPLGFGGPYLGFMAATGAMMRKLPGRIVGETVDADGNRAYVLTLQAREQHIRREKANSNICSNQSLMALYVTIYLSLMGKKGLRQVCDLSYGAAHYLHDRLIETGLFSEAFNRPFLKEFALRTDIPADRLQQALLDGGFFGALPTEEGLVTFCATERRTREEIDRMIDLIKQIQL